MKLKFIQNGELKMKRLSSNEELLVLQATAKILGVQLALIINTPYIEIISLLNNKIKTDMIDVDDVVQKMMELRERK